MMNAADAVSWATALILMVMLASPRDAEAVLGIPEFLEMGKCAKVPLKEDFDPVKYTGLWFDIESVPNEYQHTKKCVTQNYAWKDNYMNVATRGLTSEDKKVRQGAIMRVADKPTPNPAHMTVEAAGVPAAPYQIISTDYRTYSCVYSCLEYFGFRAEFFWIFGRNPMLPAEKIRLCHRTFENLGVNYKKMVPIVQGAPCPYSDKLDQMLAENEDYLLNILGPYQPTSSVPTPLPLTTAAPNSPSSGTVEEELKEIKEIVKEEKKAVQELEEKILLISEENLPGNTGESEDKEMMGDDPNAATCVSTSATLVLIFVTALLQR